MNTTPVGMEPTVLTADAIGELPKLPFGGLEGVEHKVLWRNEREMAGVLTVPAGHRLGMHAHRVNHHHVWVLDGRAVILGEELGAGSYCHIPSGVDHDLDATTTEGCTAFYLYIRPPV